MTPLEEFISTVPSEELPRFLKEASLCVGVATAILQFAQQRGQLDEELTGAAEQLLFAPIRTSPNVTTLLHLAVQQVGDNLQQAFSSLEAMEVEDQEGDATDGYVPREPKPKEEEE